MRTLLVALMVTGVVSVSASPESTTRQLAGFEVEEVGPDLYVLRSPPGGNILVYAGPENVLIVDAQDGDLADSLAVALNELGAGNPDLVINTHYHWDHIGGNGAMMKGGAVALAHVNVPIQAAIDTLIEGLDWHREAADPASLPNRLVAADTVLPARSGHIEVAHRSAAHTDGDLTVFFTSANVLHTGDLVEVDAYPFVDWWAGGSLDGLIAAVDSILVQSDENTVIVPGHGRTVDRSFVREYRAMLATVRTEMQAAIAAGRSWDEIREMGITTAFDDANGGPRRGRQFLGVLYLGLREAPGGD